MISKILLLPFFNSGYKPNHSCATEYMSRTHKDNLILLSNIPYRDSDIIVNFLSATHGKLSTVIYGARKIGKKTSFSFHPGDIIEVEFKKQENRDFITVLNSNGLLLIDMDRFPYNRFLFHCYFLELAAKIAKPEMPSAELFEMLRINSSIKWHSSTHSVFIGWILWKIIKFGGYQIDLDSCEKCGKNSWKDTHDNERIYRKEVYSLSKNSGRIACKSCIPHPNSGQLITPAMMKLLWIMESSVDFLDFKRDFPTDIVNPLIILLNQYLIQCYEIEPKSLSLFLSSIK